MMIPAVAMNTRAIDIIWRNIPMSPFVFVKRSIAKAVEAIIMTATVAQSIPVGSPVVVYSSVPSGRSFFDNAAMSPQRSNNARLVRIVFMPDCSELSLSTISMSILNVSRSLCMV